MSKQNPLLFVGRGSSVFVSRTSSDLSKRGFNVELLDLEKTSSNQNRFVRTIIQIVQTFLLIWKYEPSRKVVIHSITAEAIWLIPLLRLRFKHIVGLAYGSDILGRSKKRDFFLEKSLRLLTKFVATNTNVLEEAIKSFPVVQTKAPAILRFGLPVFEELDKLGTCSNLHAKNSLGFNTDKFLVAVGYGATPNQRHFEVLESLAKQSRFDEIPVEFVVPLQYGDKAYAEKISKICKDLFQPKSNIDITTLTNFHDPKTSAKMRLATNCLINHSKTDAFSGTVQETLYAGNFVAAQINLPYSEMPGYGAQLVPYTSLDELWGIIEKMATNQIPISNEIHSETKRNLAQLSSWEYVSADWANL